MRLTWSRLRLLALAALAGAVSGSLRAASPEPLLLELDEVQVSAKVRRPLEDYVEFPRYDSVALSPGGTRLAMGWSEDNFQRQVTIVDFPSMQPLHSDLLQTFLGVSDIQWINEELLTVQPDWPLHGFLRIREPLGSILVRNTTGANVLAFNVPPPGNLEPLAQQAREEAVTSGARQLNTGRSNHPESGKRPDLNAQGPVRLVAARTPAADQSILQTLRTDKAGNTDGYGVYALNARNGEQRRIASLPLADARIVTGPAQLPALAWGRNANNELVIYHLAPDARGEGPSWQLAASSGSDRRGLAPVAWSGSGEEYYCLDGRDLATRAVVLWDTSSNQRRVLYRHPDTDIESFSLDPSGKPWMFSGAGHFPVYWYPDPRHPLAVLHQTLARKLANEQVEIVSATDDMAYAVVWISSGARPPVYMVMDVRSAQALSGMQTYPKLKGTRLAPVDAIEFRARDGLPIHGYLTTPLDDRGKPRTGLPLLVIAHDGPEQQGPQEQPGSYRYEYERQLFASRGYAVLQVNHRGSRGRGLAFERAGEGRWGREVQDDYADAVNWAIRDGVAAKGQVCFYGTGFGAYSAMMTAARNPDLFNCLIGVAGIYDLPALADGGKLEFPRRLRAGFGSDDANLKALSPIAHADEIKAATLLLYQPNDDTVPSEQSSAMRRALKAAGNTPKLETIGAGYSAYFTPQNRAAVYTQILRFLNKQTGTGD